MNTARFLSVEEHPAGEMDRSHARQVAARVDVARGVVDDPKRRHRQPASSEAGLQASHGRELVAYLMILQRIEVVAVRLVDAGTELRICLLQRAKAKEPNGNHGTTRRSVRLHTTSTRSCRNGTWAFRVITTSSATFAQFAQALQDAKFATHANYAADLQSNSFRAIKGAQTWIAFQTHNLADELAKTTNNAAVKALNAELELS